METNNYPEQAQLAAKGWTKYFLIAAILILISAPIVWLLLSRKETHVLPQPIGLAKLEKMATDQPTYANLITLSAGYINAKLPEKAIPVLNRALQIDAKKADAYNNLGVAYTMIGDFDKGVENCSRAVKIDSTSKLYFNNLKWAATEKNNLLTRIKSFEQQPSVSRNADYYINYGLCYYKLKDYRKSLNVWSEGLVKYPVNVNLINNVGASLMMLGETDKAIARFQQALKADPSSQLSKNNLAWGLEEQKKLKK